jgi:hypothetical protein
MERRKILIIGMFDSIHLARWLEQFKNDNIDFTLVPSKKFRHCHYNLSKLLESREKASFLVVWPYKCIRFAGYFDFILVKIYRILGLNYRQGLLKRVLKKHKFNLVHAFEIQVLCWQLVIHQRDFVFLYFEKLIWLFI